VFDVNSVMSLTSEEYGLINRALSTYELLGLFIEKRYISKSDALIVWARPVCRAWKLGAAFVEHRQTYVGDNAWRHYEKLAKLSQKFLEKREMKVNYERF
jgi:hypothetical protein